jgi:hypothetical protein
MKPLWLIGAVTAIVSQAVLAAPVQAKFDKVADNIYGNL